MKIVLIAALALLASCVATPPEPDEILFFEEDRATFRAEAAYLHRVNRAIVSEHGRLSCRDHVEVARTYLYSQWRQCPLGYYESPNKPGHEVLYLVSPHGNQWVVDNGADGGVIRYHNWRGIKHRPFGTDDSNDCFLRLSFQQKERLDAILREYGRWQ